MNRITTTGSRLALAIRDFAALCSRNKLLLGNTVRRCVLLTQVAILATACADNSSDSVGSTTSAVFSPDGKRIVSASNDGRTHTWSSSGEPIFAMIGLEQGYLSYEPTESPNILKATGPAWRSLRLVAKDKQGNKLKLTPTEHPNWDSIYSL